MKIVVLIWVALGLLLAQSRAQKTTESTQPAGRFADVFGEKIYYVDVGSGPAVVLLHGLADDIGVWEQVIPALAKTHRVIALDQIGFGRSGKPLLSYRVATLVDFVDRFLSDLKIDHATLVGNSLGGWVAADFALAHSERVDRLVLSDSAGYAQAIKGLSQRTLSALHFASRDDIRELGPLTFQDKRFYQDLDGAFKQRVSAGDAYTVNQIVASMIRGDDVLDGRVGQIHKPTLIVWGREDKLIPLDFAERFHKEIAGSQLAVIDNCGHMPHVECPERFNAAVTEFLADKN